MQFVFSYSKEIVEKNITKTILNKGFKKCAKKYSYKKCYRALDNKLYEYIFRNQRKIKSIDNDFNDDDLVGLSWINANDGPWSFGCDFFENDLRNVISRGEDCSGKCKQTTGCTHYTWTNFNGGTCWMKQGPISQADAIKADNGFVCGILETALTDSTVILKIFNKLIYFQIK